jgi:hypothetical protein
MGIEELRYVLNEMEKLVEEHPKARVIYNYEQKAIQILYPLPVEIIGKSCLESKRGVKNKIKIWNANIFGCQHK